MERSSLPEADKPPSNVTALWGATWRNSLRLARNSASLVSALVIPGMFMLAFWGVFGHAAGRSGSTTPCISWPPPCFSSDVRSRRLGDGTGG